MKTDFIQPKNQAHFGIESIADFAALLNFYIALHLVDFPKIQN